MVYTTFIAVFSLFFGRIASTQTRETLLELSYRYAVDFLEKDSPVVLPVDDRSKVPWVINYAVIRINIAVNKMKQEGVDVSSLEKRVQKLNDDVEKLAEDDVDLFAAAEQCFEEAKNLKQTVDNIMERKQEVVDKEEMENVDTEEVDVATQEEENVNNEDVNKEEDVNNEDVNNEDVNNEEDDDEEEDEEDGDKEEDGYTEKDGDKEVGFLERHWWKLLLLGAFLAVVVSVLIWRARFQQPAQQMDQAPQLGDIELGQLP